jgi:Uma2 family endonuclease
MSMVVRRPFGPQDHGRSGSDLEFESATYQEGYSYEVIDGRLYVSPLPNPDGEDLENWLHQVLDAYRRSHPEVINRVSSGARIFVPGTTRTTAPEPDVAAYRDFPLHLPRRQRDWRTIHPVLVAEVLTSADGEEKDLVRNVDLYHRVPSIKEYWVVDGRADPDKPTLRVYRRWGAGWRERAVPYGTTYTTRLLPGFALVVDPDQRP